jgi:arylsulfatase A-like enzyme
MHVPMLMSWPGVIPKGTVRAEIGNHIDLLPTICKAAGAPLPADRTLDGADAMPMAATGAKSPHDAIYWSSSGQTAVRRGPWKLVRNGRTYDGTPEGGKPLAGDDALFLSNLEEDPGESRNLRHAHANVADELLTMAEQWLKTVKEP